MMITHRKERQDCFTRLACATVPGFLAYCYYFCSDECRRQAQRDADWSADWDELHEDELEGMT